MKAFDISSTQNSFVPAPAGTSREDGHARHHNRSLYNLVGKRIFDLLLAIGLLPALLPVILVLWIVARRDGEAGFFGHRRVGLGGKVFSCWKIRTMVVDAEQRLIKYLAENPEAAEEWAREQKLKNDPRITKIGAFLRATSLDELPQIWNVLRGEMSFVGPRPVVRSELCRYGRNRRAYLVVRPGLTGLWQVSGRNDVSYDERVNIDVQYANDMSLIGDIKILLRTVKVVFQQTGI